MARIIIVEDNHELASLVAAAVRTRGHTAQATHTGRSAMEAIMLQPFELAVVDLLLPDMTGSQVLGELKHRAVPAIAMSGVFKGQRFVTEAIEVHGARAFFEKPFDMNALLDTIDSLVGAASLELTAADVDGELEELAPIDDQDDEPFILPAIRGRAASEVESPLGDPEDEPIVVPAPRARALRNAIHEQSHTQPAPAPRPPGEPKITGSPALDQLARPPPPPPEDEMEMTSRYELPRDELTPIRQPPEDRGAEPAAPARAGEPAQELAEPTQPEAAPSGAAPSDEAAPIAAVASSETTASAGPATAEPTPNAAEPEASTGQQPPAVAQAPAAPEAGAPNPDFVLPFSNREKVWNAPEKKSEPTSLESQAGTLEGTAVPRLLTAYYQARHTGELRLRQGNVVKVVYFDKGQPIYAASNLAQERFGRFCVRKGVLNAAKLEEVVRLVKEENLRTAEAMIKLGLLTTAKRASLVQEQVREIIWSTFGWMQGDFTFIPKRPAAAGLVKLSLFPANLILEGVQRTETLLSLRQKLPPKRRYVPTADPPYELHQISLSGAQALLMAHADGSKTVEDLLALTDMPERDALGTLAGLELLGFITERRDESRAKRITFGL